MNKEERLIHLLRPRITYLIATHNKLTILMLKYNAMRP